MRKLELREKVARKPQVTKTLKRVVKILECLAANGWHEVTFTEAKNWLCDGSAINTRVLQNYESVASQWGVALKFTTKRSSDRVKDHVLYVSPADAMGILAKLENLVDMECYSSIKKSLVSQLPKAHEITADYSVSTATPAPAKSNSSKFIDLKLEIDLENLNLAKAKEAANKFETLKSLGVIFPADVEELASQLQRLAELDKEREELMKSLSL
jgi:hypothetical protein